VIFPFLLAATVTAAASASAAPASASASPSASAALPAGHPRVDRSPHGAGGGARMFRPPADTADTDPKLPPGVIRVELRDALDHVLAHHAVELGVVHQSVAKGERHEHREATTDDAGNATFGGLDASSNVAYRVTAHESDATYAATPFRLTHDHGMHVVLHVYPVMHELPSTAQIGARCIVYVEVKDDRIQLQEQIDLFNGTPAAWVPRGVVLRLPDTFTALNSMQQMSDIGVVANGKRGAELHGTFVPGDNRVEFTWQLPYSGDPAIDFDVGMPPATRQAVVLAAAAPGMKLEVPGFRDAVAQVDDNGQRQLGTGKQVNDNEPAIRSVHVSLSGLPTPGPTRLFATALAVLGLASGIYLATKRGRRGSTKAAVRRDRERILDELDQLELARERGDVGPKTYERARRELVDELAALLAASK
jgi:hypothetical protein